MERTHDIVQAIWLALISYSFRDGLGPSFVKKNLGENGEGTPLFEVCGDRDELIWSISNRLAAISKGDFSASRFGGLGRRGDRGWTHSIARTWIPIGSPLTCGLVYLLPFSSYSAGSKTVSVRPPVGLGYDDKYCPRSYHFIERQ